MVLPVLALAVTSGVLVVLVIHLQNLNGWVHHTDVVIARVTRLERLSSDHQSECRGYLLTGNEALLKPFAAVDRQLTPTLEELERLVSDNPEQVMRLRALRERVQQWRAFASEQVARRRGGATVEQASLRMTAGKVVMDDLRAQVRAFVEAEERLRASRVARARDVTRLTLGAAFVLVVVLGGFAALAAKAQVERVMQTYGDALVAQQRAQDAVRSSEERLRAQAEALREADRRKDEFLGMLSHELRNPLAPIWNSIYILNRADPTSEQARRAKDVLGRQAGHLGRIVDDLLDVTRIARGKIELHRERLDLNEIVRRAGEDHRALLQEREIELVIEIPREPTWVEGDATRLAQIVGNLLLNSGKFTGSGGEVMLTVSSGPSAAAIHVRDTGSGIDPGLLEHVFEPFTQGSQGLARTGGGLGLGLALVKGMAELHGGSVAARSEGAGRGTELVVQLPLAGAPVAGANEGTGHAAR